MNKLNNKKLLIILIVGLLIGISFIIGGIILNSSKNNSSNLDNLISYTVVPVNNEKLRTKEEVQKEIDNINKEIEILEEKKKNSLLQENGMEEYRKIDDEIMSEREKIYDLEMEKDMIIHEEEIKKEHEKELNRYHGIYGNVNEIVDEIKEMIEAKKESSICNILIIIGGSIIGITLVSVIVLYFIMKKRNINKVSNQQSTEINQINNNIQNQTISTNINDFNEIQNNSVNINQNNGNNL